MRKYWIIAAVLVVLCAAVPVVAQEVLPTLEEQVKDILVRLEKVEAQEERIEALERQVAKLLSLSDVPPEIPAEGVVEMTEAQYKRWIDEEIIRISLLVPEWMAAFESDDVDEVFSTLFDLLTRDSNSTIHIVESLRLTLLMKRLSQNSPVTWTCLSHFETWKTQPLWRLCPFL